MRLKQERLSLLRMLGLLGLSGALLGPLPAGLPTASAAPAPAGVAAPVAAENVWQGSYFANVTLAGAPALVRDDPAIDFDWGTGAPAPGLPVDNFSVRWTRDVAFDGSCREVLTLSDDGIRVLVDGRLAVSYWFDQGGTERRDQLCPGAGIHTVTVELYERQRHARARFVLAPGAPGLETAPPPTSSGSTTEPALLASHDVRGPLPESRHLAYRPRQFSAGTVVRDVAVGSQTVNQPGPYAGWDLLATPNEGIMRISDRADWLVLDLNRPATLAVVWRWGGPLPAWLRDWQRGSNVVISGGTFQTFTRQVGAGEFALGGVYDPGAVPGPHAMRNTYWVLLGESDGRASSAPAVPSGREVARANETCPAWVHDQYVTTGPDGRTYATWHPQIDPV
ncbi:MAG: PA14 domain-containing protein, partial [Chloroflexota bacterium]|nr:PA14 domain-containing protein [Chloroflexota bacterium]